MRRRYLSFRNKFKPKRIRLVLIAESPQVSGKYFYDATGDVSEPLFKALIKHLGMKTLPAAKEIGLRKFQQKGWLLVDATYEPVNKSHSRNRVIKRDYPKLRQDLVRLTKPKQASVPLVLIKANVCRILELPLRADGFNVLNNGRLVYFPSYGRQNDFRRQFGMILKSAGLA
jgi:hypothetical protein